MKNVLYLQFFFTCFLFYHQICASSFVEKQVIHIKNIEIERESFKGGVYKYNADIRVTLGSHQINQTLDFDQLKDFILNFLKNYTHTPAMWELVNKDLVNQIAKIFPNFPIIKSEIKVDANTRRPFDRWSLIDYNKEKGIVETFGFAFQLDNKTLSIAKPLYFDVTLQYVKEIPAKDYIDFIIIKDDLKNLFEKHYTGTNAHSNLLHMSMRQFLQNYPMIESFKIQMHQLQVKEGSYEEAFEWSIEKY